MRDETVKFLKQAFCYLLIVAVVVIFVAIALPDHNRRDPYSFYSKERQYCIDRGGSVKEDYRGYYDGCILPGDK